MFSAMSTGFDANDRRSVPFSHDANAPKDRSISVTIRWTTRAGRAAMTESGRCDG